MNIFVFGVVDCVDEELELVANVDIAGALEIRAEVGLVGVTIAMCCGVMTIAREN